MRVKMRTRRFTGVFQPWTDIWSRSGWRVQTHCKTGLGRAVDPFGGIALTGAAEACLAQASRLARPAGCRRAVVVLHGLGHHPGGMARMAGALADTGWAVANIGYASLRQSLEHHARAASRVAAALAEDGAGEVAFVGHSLGGLVARAAMARAAEDGWRPGRLVLIGSPARGAGIAGMATRVAAYRALTGSCGQTVTPAGAALVPVPDCRGLAVIAGGTGGRGFNPLLPGDNDGIVTVEETRLPGREDAFTRVRALHTPLAASPGAVISAMSFLESGRMAA
ncbi:alpha/beta fold hydrolase [Roseomonas sp. M0104]|uniref:Alpha/beta fold hydrolase n=1 Tax=Teichococcus coralli TaxID=2545983 RepID=A0A845B9V0_9PROT|nr:alpha/beta fold hydrolase [Pseudoroseomonas coralli]MXP62874.1 alpha/beta fold hydrolase [Pseudoroseomonas coralli]